MTSGFSSGASGANTSGAGRDGSLGAEPRDVAAPERAPPGAASSASLSFVAGMGELGAAATSDRVDAAGIEFVSRAPGAVPLFPSRAERPSGAFGDALGRASLRASSPPAGVGAVSRAAAADAALSPGAGATPADAVRPASSLLPSQTAARIATDASGTAATMAIVFIDHPAAAG